MLVCYCISGDSRSSSEGLEWVGGLLVTQGREELREERDQVVLDEVPAWRAWTTPRAEAT